MGLLLLKTNDCNLIYEFNKGTILSVKVMKSKERPKKAVIQPLKVVLVEQGSTIITHIVCAPRVGLPQHWGLMFFAYI